MLFFERGNTTASRVYGQQGSFTSWVSNNGGPIHGMYGPNNLALDPASGGLVCRDCGSARIRVSAVQRARLSRAARGESAALVEGDVTLALDLVERVFAVHAGVE